MKKTYLLFCISIFLCSFLYSQAGKHSVSLSVGYGIPFEYSIYVNNEDPDIDFWTEPESDIPVAAFYEYGISDHLKAGAKLEYEKINYDSYYTGKTYANRIVIGIHCLGSYPETSFHSEFGGFLNYGVLNSDDFDASVSGPEYGMMMGPGYRLGKINIAMHLQLFFGPYFVTDSKTPESVLLMYPRIYAKVSYEF